MEQQSGQMVLIMICTLLTCLATAASLFFRSPKEENKALSVTVARLQTKVHDVELKVTSMHPLLDGEIRLLASRMATLTSSLDEVKDSNKAMVQAFQNLIKRFKT